MRVLYFEYNLYAEDTQIGKNLFFELVRIGSYQIGKNLFFEFQIHAFN